MRTWILGIGLLALGIAGGLSLLASERADGLEHTLAVVQAGEGAAVAQAPMPDYQAPLEAPAFLRRIVAGLSGTLVVLGITLLLGFGLRRLGGRGSRTEPAPRATAGR